MTSMRRRATRRTTAPAATAVAANAAHPQSEPAQRRAGRSTAPSGRHGPQGNGSDRKKIGEGWAAALLRQQQLQQFIDAACLAEQLPLPQVAAAVAKECQLAYRFHALGNHLHAEAVSHVDNGTHQYCV